MAKQPLVSIITPCYNHEPYLDDYFGGLLAQTYEPVELILFDDGSTDGSWDKVQAYLPAVEQKLHRVIAERHENVGLIAEISQAIPRIGGEFVCILESDDYYLPTMLEESVRFMLDHPDVGAVHGDTDYLLPDRVERAYWRSTGRRIPTGDVFEQLLVGNFVMTCAFCCRTALLRKYADYDRYRQRGYVSADWAMYLDIAKHARFGYIDKPLARYRVLTGSMSRPMDPDKHFEYHRSLLKVRLDYAGTERVSSEVAGRVAREYHTYLYRQGLALGRPDDHVEGLRWLRRHDPERYGGHWRRVTERVVRFELLWRIGRYIGAVNLGWRMWRLLARRRRTSERRT